MPPVYDQGQLGSCTANAIAAALDFDRGKQGEAFIGPSRLFVYYNERVIEGSVSSDAGAMIRDGIKSVNNQGACPETEWPYNINKFANLPSKQCYVDALQYESVLYQAVDNSNADTIKAALNQGYVVVFGFTVYDSFMTSAVARTGIVPQPQPGESVLGGHACVIVGYDDAKQQFIFRNSWGTGWGDKGYGYLPYGYVTSSDMSDFWVLETVK